MQGRRGAWRGDDAQCLRQRQQARVQDGARDRRQPAALGCLDLGKCRADELGRPLQGRHALKIVADIDQHVAHCPKIDQGHVPFRLKRA